MTEEQKKNQIEAMAERYAQSYGLEVTSFVGKYNCVTVTFKTKTDGYYASASMELDLPDYLEMADSGIRHAIAQMVRNRSVTHADVGPVASPQLPASLAIRVVRELEKRDFAVSTLGVESKTQVFPGCLEMGDEISGSISDLARMLGVA